MCVSASTLLGCSCCSTVDKTLVFVAQGAASRLKINKSHWAAGRVGDIDFIGSTKTKGKVRLDMEDRSRNTEVLWMNHSSLSPCPVCQGEKQHRPGADLPDADRGVGPGFTTPGGGPGGGRWAGTDEALAQGHAEKRTGEGCTEHRWPSSHQEQPQLFKSKSGNRFFCFVLLLLLPYSLSLCLFYSQCSCSVLFTFFPLFGVLGVQKDAFK